MKENRLSVNELLCEMRLQGISSIEDINYAVLEQNGKISAFKKSDSPLSHSVIIDGETDEKTLCALGRTREWLGNELKKRRVSQKEIFLMTVSDDGNIYIIRKESPK